MVEDERQLNRLAPRKSKVQVSGGKPCTEHKNMIRTGRKIGEHRAGRFIDNSGDLGIEERGMDLDRGRKIRLGFAKRLHHDSDGSRRTRLPSRADVSEGSSKNKEENYSTRRTNHNKNLPFRTCRGLPEIRAA